MFQKTLQKMQEKEKEDFKSSPFIIYFEYGAQKEGYWTFDHMVLPFEDCGDCFEALYDEMKDSCWMFTHSYGHGQGREDGLQ